MQINIFMITQLEDGVQSMPTYFKLVNHFPPGCVNLLSRQL